MERKPEPTALWSVQVQIPVPIRLVRRTSEKALGAWLAKELVDSFGKVPPEFIVNSARKVREDVAARERQGLRLVGPDGKEFGSGKPYRM